MNISYYDVRPPVLHGDKRSGRLQRFADSIGHEVNSCIEPFPDKGVCMVTKGSPLSYKKAVESIGVYFRREMNYDIRPFTAAEYSDKVYRSKSERATDDNTRSFLWYNAEEGQPGHWETFGGCTFRLIGKTWMLMWIWIHPYERRKGYLKSVWPFFRSMFGVFVPYPPLSEGMETFIRLIGYNKVLLAEMEGRKTSNEQKGTND